MRRSHTYNGMQLIQRSDLLVKTMLRDQEELKKFGIGDKQIQELRALRNRLSDFPYDDECLMEVQEVGISQREYKTKLYQGISTLKLRIRICLPQRKDLYKRLCRNVSINTKSSEFLESGLYALATAKEHAQVLIEAGQDESFIHEFQTCLQAFEEGLHKHRKAKEKRTQLAEERVRLSNELMDMLRIISCVGKEIWKTKSEAYWNDYVLFPKKRNKKSLVENKQQEED